MKSLILACVMLSTSILATHLQAQQSPSFWTPAANPGSDGLWSTATNWNPHTVPGPSYKAFFNASPAVPCVVNGTAGGCQISVGDGGPGLLIVTNGGNLTAGDNTLGGATNNYGLDQYGWTGIGTAGNGTMIIANGGAATFRYHLWIGFSAGATGTFIMNGGTASVGGAFGLGFNGGTGVVHINGGTLTLSQWATNSIQGNTSVLDVAGGTVAIAGNQVASIQNFITAGKITGYGGAGTVNVNFSGGTTTLTASGPPPTVSLSIGLSPSNLTLYWPTSSIYYALEFATNLTTPIAWQAVTNSVLTSNGTNRVTLPLPHGPTYFTLNTGVDASTMNHKLMMGYQAWFGCPKDGSVPNVWWHWFHNQTPTAANVNTDFLPDMSELSSNELFATQMTYSNGAPYYFYSAAVQQTVVRHFKWMQQNQLDGVFLQRFLTDLADPAYFSFRNQTTTNVRVGAETYGRVFAIMYDLSGEATNNLISNLTNDWNYLVNTMHVTNSSRYLHHRGKPVVALWGFGFNDGGHLASPQQAQTLINWFKSQGVTVMGGVPTHWRTLNGDAYTNAAWTPVYLSFDVVSPWAVGRYGDSAGADNYTTTVTSPDLNTCTNNGVDYMPVVFPGFSWHNENGGTLNQIPRNGGQFYWRQVYDDVHAGCNMIYGAMFNEVNEGTAMYKLVPTSNQLPVGSFLALDADGDTLPSDWYLQLANQAGKMLRGEIPLQTTLPISP